MKFFVCFILGWLYTLSFSPYNISAMSLISIIAFILILELDSFKDSIIKSSLFSFGYFISGTYWLENVIRLYSDTSYVLTIIIISFFIIYLSLFIVIPVAISSYFKNNLKLHENYSLIIMSILLTFFEIIRSNIFTGFSWFNFGQAAISSPLEYFFPVIGVHGITLIIFLSAIVIINFVRVNNLKFFLPLSVILLLFYFNIYSKEWTLPSSKVFNISVVQPNFSNKLSYSKDETIRRMSILRDMSLKPSVKNSDIILWPEAPISIPFNDLRNSYYKNILLEFSDTTTLVAGNFFREQNNIYNSIINISSSESFYHKKHLVPFGEYLPFRKSMFYIYNFIGLNTYDISPGKLTNIIEVNNLKAYALICYESIFSEEALIKNTKADFIINVSNDGWFGDSLAPYQHLDALRMRSLENQRYSARSTNNGISAVISPYGEIIKFIPYNKKGSISADIVARNGHTPLSKYGYNILYIFIFIIFIYASIYFNIKSFKR